MNWFCLIFITYLYLGSFLSCTYSLFIIQVVSLSLPASVNVLVKAMICIEKWSRVVSLSLETNRSKDFLLSASVVFGRSLCISHHKYYTIVGREQVCSCLRANEWATRCSCSCWAYWVNCGWALPRCRRARCAPFHWQHFSLHASKLSRVLTFKHLNLW